VGVGMHGLCCRRSPKQPGGLGITILFCLFGKGEILSVGLGFTSKGLLQIFSCRTYVILLVYNFMVLPYQVER
jgi:hypothetical protein